MFHWTVTIRNVSNQGKEEWLWTAVRNGTFTSGESDGTHGSFLSAARSAEAWIAVQDIRDGKVR